MLYIAEIKGKTHALMLRFLLAGSDTLHPRSRSMPAATRFVWIRSRVISKYAVAVLSVAAALIIAQWPSLHLETAPVSLFFCAVMISAWFGGFRPGLFATVLCTLAFYYYFLVPMQTLAAKPEEMPRLIVFTGSALVVGVLSAAQRSATESLRDARDDLLGTLRELQKTNEALQAESHERKQAEEKLRRSESYLAEAQRLSHTGSWASVPALNEIKYLSEECYRVLGFDPDDGLPRYEEFFKRIYFEDQGKVATAVETAGREKVEFELDYRIVHPDGQLRDIHVLGNPVLDSSGRLVEFIGTVMDVTARKRAEQEREKLRQAQADLARASRVTTMGELSASLAHEIKQPIAAAITDANTCVRWLTRDQPDLEEARSAALRVVRDATRASEIVSHVRLLFKKGSSQREPVDVNEIIREMIVLLHNETTRYSIVVQAKLAEDLPNIMGDRVQLQQVMMNLILNSIEAMRDVDGARELTIKSEPAENGKIMISVSDTGVGLPTQEKDQLFNAFFTTKDHGTGMGLSISRSIVESHEGRLWAAGNSPRGANFCFTLPASVEGHE
jgi:PAS domain S-box-containing protein